MPQPGQPFPCLDIIAESSSCLCLSLGWIFSPWCCRIRPIVFRVWKYDLRATNSTSLSFFASDGYLTNTTEKYVHLNMCSSVISDQESLPWTRWLDTCIIASAIHYACRHIPHLKHCRQQESLAACQPWLMWSPSKTGEIHQRNFQEKGYRKHNCSEWGHCWISYSFPICPQSSQMLCLTRIMRPFSHEEIAFTATSSRSSGFLAAIQSVCVCPYGCVGACVWVGLLTQLNTVALLLDLTQGW